MTSFLLPSSPPLESTPIQIWEAGSVHSFKYQLKKHVNFSPQICLNTKLQYAVFVHRFAQVKHFVYVLSVFMGMLFFACYYYYFTNDKHEGARQEQWLIVKDFFLID